MIPLLFAGMIPLRGSITYPHAVMLALMAAVREAVIVFCTHPVNGRDVVAQSISILWMLMEFGPTKKRTISFLPSSVCVLSAQDATNILSTSRQLVVVWANGLIRQERVKKSVEIDALRIFLMNGVCFRLQRNGVFLLSTQNIR